MDHLGERVSGHPVQEVSDETNTYKIIECDFPPKPTRFVSAVDPVGITRDFVGEKAALVVSISNQNSPQSVLRVVVFSHLFPLGMDIG